MYIHINIPSIHNQQLYNYFSFFRTMRRSTPTYLFLSRCLLAIVFVFVLIIPSKTSLIPLMMSTDQGGTSECDLGDDDIMAGAGSVHVCDDSNSDNWSIYCSGKILEVGILHLIWSPTKLILQAVNYYQLLAGNDSKDFVDRPLKRSASEVLESFNEEFKKNGSESVSIRSDVDPKRLSKFLDENFHHAGGELEK
jgi:hypothetical protein